MSDAIPWIREKLLESYPNLDQDGGVDLNCCGGITGNEIADTDGDHFVSDDEARAFYVANQNVLNRRIPYFKWSSVLSPDNPIHELIYLESKLRPASEVKGTYEFLGKVLAETNRLLEEKEQDGELDPFWKMMQVSLALGSSARFESQPAGVGSSLFISNVSAGVLDCDTATDILLAVGYEKHWPVYEVQAPHHIFARWDDGQGERENFEMRDGDGHSDEFYVQHLHIPQAAIESGAYLANLSPEELRGFFFENIAIELSAMGKFQESLSYYAHATELSPRNAMAYYNRAVVFTKLDRWDDAISSVSRAIELDPQNRDSYVLRAEGRFNQRDFEEAIGDLDMAIQLMQNDCDSYYIRSAAESEIGRTEESAADLATANRICPELGDFPFGDYRALQNHLSRRVSEFLGYCKRGREKSDHGDLEGALEDFTRALEMDPTATEVRVEIAGLKYRLGRIEECIQDLNGIIDQYPSYVVAYVERGKAYLKSGHYEEALRDAERALELDPHDSDALELRQQATAALSSQGQ